MRWPSGWLGDNLEKNEIPKELYHLEQTTLDQYQAPGTGLFDLVVANIIAEIILEIIPEIKLRTKPGGTVILSGIIVEKKEAILKTLRRHHFSIMEIREEGEWVAVCAGNTGGA